MQTVWSRVAQVRATCRCASCTVKTSVTRHSGTATGKRPTKYLTSSTLLYSGIFAVAATTDALVKEHRRLQWDDAIAKAKEGVEQVQVRLEAFEGTKVFEEAEVRQRNTENTESFLNDEDALYQEPSSSLHGQLWPESSGNDYEQGNFAPQSIWASPRYQARWKSRLWTPKKIHLTELAMDRLMLRILLQLDDQDLQNVSIDSFSDDFKGLISQPRRQLENFLGIVNRAMRSTRALDPQQDAAAFAELPGVISRYSQDNNSRHIETATAVEKSIMHSFKRYSDGCMSNTQLVLDTLHSLVTSPSPPSLGTFNRMIDGFSTKAVDPRITQHVINSMRWCATRMNEQSLISILEHYIRTNDYARFCFHVELMQGLHGGLCLARPDIMITDKSQGRLVPITQDGVQKIVQKPVANPLVFGTLIQGVLHFEGFDAALDMCQSMGRDGWGLSMKGLTPLLRECARRGNWDAGTAVWDQIQRVQALSRKRGRPELIQSWTYATMLRLCVACQKRLDFSRILEEAVKTRHMSRNALMGQVKRLNLAQSEDNAQTRQESSLDVQQSQSADAMNRRRSIRWRGIEELASRQAPSPAALESILPQDINLSLQTRPVALSQYPETATNANPNSLSILPEEDQGSTVVAERSAESQTVTIAEAATLPGVQQLPKPELRKSQRTQLVKVVRRRAQSKAGSDTYQRPRLGPDIHVRQDQLLGMGPSQDLDEWELTERPMNMMSAAEPRMYT